MNCAVNPTVGRQLLDSWSGRFAFFLVLSLMLFLCFNLRADGTVDFGNDSSAKVINGQTSTPVSTNDHIRAALYWAPLGSNTLVQIGATITNIGSPLPGLFASRTCTTGAGTPGGSFAQFQVRAWAGAFATYEQATANNGLLVGHSAIFQVQTGNPAGDPPTPPGSLIAGGLQTFTLTPNSNPPSFLVLTCASNKTVECASSWSFDPPSASTTCGNTNITVTILGTLTNGLCPQTITRTWLATDACGNTNTCSQTVTIVDTTAPVVTCGGNKTVDCGAAWSFDAPSASDTCSGTNVTITILATLTNGLCPQNIIRTWLATDACGNTNTCSQTVTVVDTSAPVLSCASNKTADCASAWNFDVPSVIDFCGNTNLTLTSDTVTNRLCPLTITRTWLAANACGYSNSCSQTVTVICTNCPVILVTKNCPAYPVPPGGTLVFTGTVTNASDAPLTNVFVFNDKPSPNTLVFGPTALEPGAGAAFTGSYSVPGCACGPFADTLTARGTTPDGITFTNYVTTACPGTNFGFPGDLNGDGIVDQEELNKVLERYWPNSPAIYMTNPVSLGGGRFQFELTNASAWNFSVLASTNMVDWTNLPGQAHPVYQFLDPDAAAEAAFRFYRLRWP